MIHTTHLRRLAALGAAALLAAACRESVQSTRAIAPQPTSDARLELSDSAAAKGAAVSVVVRVTGMSIASATGRIAYDSTGLEFVGEAPLSDGATRVVNPMPGLLRFAVVSPDSFPGGRIHELRFIVHAPAALRTMRLSIEEAHSPTRADAAAFLRTRVP